MLITLLYKWYNYSYIPKLCNAEEFSEEMVNAFFIFSFFGNIINSLNLCMFFFVLWIFACFFFIFRFLHVFIPFFIYYACFLFSFKQFMLFFASFWQFFMFFRVFFLFFIFSLSFFGFYIFFRILFLLYHWQGTTKVIYIQVLIV